eukprot:2414819-Pleurochrysis_carterae.AAC.1
MSARPAAAMRVCAVRSRAHSKLRTCPHFDMRTSFVEIRTLLLMDPADAKIMFLVPLHIIKSKKYAFCVYDGFTSIGDIHHLSSQHARARHSPRRQRL